MNDEARANGTVHRAAANDIDLTKPRGPRLVPCYSGLFFKCVSIQPYISCRDS